MIINWTVITVDNIQDMVCFEFTYVNNGKTLTRTASGILGTKTLDTLAQECYPAIWFENALKATNSLDQYINMTGTITV